MFTDNAVVRLFERIQGEVIYNFVLRIFNQILVEGAPWFAILAGLFFLMLITLMAMNAYRPARIVREVVIYWLLTSVAVSWALYEALVYNVVIEYPAEVAALMFSAVSDSGATSPVEILVVLWRDGVKLAWIAVNMGSIWSGLVFWYFLGIGFFLLLALAIARAIVLLLGIMLAQAIAIAIGPFILWLSIFPPLRGLLEQWIRVLVQFMFFRILITLAVVLINTIIGEDLRDAIVYAETAVTELTFELFAGDLLVMLVAYSLFTNAQHMGRSFAHGINAAANSAIGALTGLFHVIRNIRHVLR